MKNQPRELGNIQRWMQSVIMHPDGVAAGISSEAARSSIDVSTEKVEDVICRSQALTSIERLEVYGNAYFARLLECLRDEFPALAHALGEELFDGFSFGYLQAYPSTSYTLAQLGAKFPQYLLETRPEKESADGEFDWADLMIDLARLERAYSEVFDGPGVEAKQLLQPGDLSAIDPQQWTETRLVPVECLRLMKFDFPVHEYATAVRREENPPLPDAAATLLAITRRDYVVRRVGLSPVQYELLQAILDGKPLGAAIAIAADFTSMPADEFAESLKIWFKDWSTARFFDRVEVSKP